MRPDVGLLFVSALAECGPRRTLISPLNQAKDQRGLSALSAAPSRPGRAVALTSREIEVARLVARGYGNREISEELVITEKTAKNHVQHVLDKLGMRSRPVVAASTDDLGLRQ